MKTTIVHFLKKCGKAKVLVEINIYFLLRFGFANAIKISC